MVINVGLFMALLAADKTDYSLTESEQHWRKQVVTFFGCLFNLIMTCAGTSLAGAMAARTADSRLLIAPLLWASIQVCVFHVFSPPHRRESLPNPSYTIVTFHSANGYDGT